MENGIENTIEEILVEAIMTETSFIIVEGHDDIAFYSLICKDIDKKSIILAAENIAEISEGCEGVITAIEKLQNQLTNNNNEFEKYILGIIDRDVRFYRNSLPSLTSLLTLKYYSYENHLLTNYTKEKVLAHILNNDILDNMTDLLALLEEDFDSDIQKLYYFSLDALRSACEEGYEPDVCYSFEAGRIYSIENYQMLISKIQLKQNDLSTFAEIKQIDNIYSVIKGKWLLHTYIRRLMINIKKLSYFCKNGMINQCQYCKSGKYDKCRYKSPCNYQMSQIAEFFKRNYSKNEVSYIIDRLLLLA